jgi:adenylylsulfate kinase-like enzyme
LAQVNEQLDAPLELCEQRDPKGLYARARAGEITGLTGIDAPYQAPSQPDLVLHSGRETVDGAVERVMQSLAARFLHPPQLDRLTVAELSKDIPSYPEN